MRVEMKRITRKLSVSIVSLACLASACVGDIIDGEGQSPAGKDPTNGQAGSGAGAATTVCNEGVCVQTSQLSRLTRTQYVHAARQLLGPSTVVDRERLPQDHQAAEIFASNESVHPIDDDIDRYSAVAEDLAEAADLEQLLPCTPQSGDRDCAEQFIDEFGARAARRALSPEEKAEYLAAFDWSMDEGDGFADAIRLVIATALQSPHFLYLIEHGQEGAPEQLSGHELANRLAFFLWREAPDDTLRQAADSGELDGPDGIEAHARRMLDDDRFDRAVREFHREWLGLGDVPETGRDPDQYPDFTPALAQSMLEASERFAVEVFRQDGAKQAKLLAADYSLVDAPLAQFYGVSAPSQGFEAQKIAQRGGLLTEPAVLLANSAEGYTTPIFRGIFLRTRILCQGLGPRPANVDEAVAEIEKTLQPDMTDRERLTALTGQGVCAGCHTLTNKIGFGFDNYDAIGQFRTSDYSGAAVDPSAELDSGGSEDHMTDVDGAYAGAREMVSALSTSTDVGRCLSVQWLRYALGRDASGDGSSAEQVFESYAAAELDLRELVVAVARSDAFRYRAVAPLAD
jgi:hypothetical protein